MFCQGSSEIQADGLQTLNLMNPNYNGYSDTSHQSGNMLILNYAAGNPINLENLPNDQPPPRQPPLVGVQLQAATGSGNLQDVKLNHLTLHSPHEVQPPRWWSAIDQTVGGNQETRHIPSGVVVSGGSSGGPAEVSVAQLGYHMPVVSPTRQALPLILSSQQTGYRFLPMDHNTNQIGLISPQTGSSGGGSGGSSASYRASAGVSSLASVVTHGMPGGHGVVLGSKYLKAAQELLNELVNIEAKENKDEVMGKGKEKAKMERESMVIGCEASGVGQIGETSKAELTTAQKQEIQMRKAKLVSMLDEFLKSTSRLQEASHLNLVEGSLDIDCRMRQTPRHVRRFCETP